MAYEDLRIFMGIAEEEGIDIIKPIFTNQLVMDFRTTYKCMTCERYGKKATCPPNIPNYDYFQRLIKCYNYGLLLGKKCSYRDTEEYNKAREESALKLQDVLLTLEYQAFQRNFYWAIVFIGGSCRVCKSCPPSGKCAVSSKGRIPMEATGIDVIKTCRQLDIEITPFPHPIEGGSQLYRIGLFLLE